MPDYRRIMDPGPNDPVTLELLKQWNPGGPPRGMELDPAYSSQYLSDEGSQNTLGNLIQSLQGASNRTENIDAGLGRLQGLQEEQKGNLQPLWDQSQESSGPGFLDQLSSGLGSVGGAVSRGLDAITPSQGTLDNLAMRLQNAHAIGTGHAPLWMQQQDQIMQIGQQHELMQMRRAQVAHQLQQQQMMKQQKDEDQALGIWKDHQMPIAMKKKLSQQLAAQGNVLAGNLHRLGDEQLVAEMDSLAPYLPKGKMEELSKLMQTPNADLEHVERWVNFAREKKKVIGDRQMKSERFADLLGRYNAGELDPTHPDYDEFKQGILEREKAQQENTEMRMKLEQMGLTKKKAEQELAASSVMPQYGPEVNLPGGNVQRDKYDPQTGQLSQITGNKPPGVSVVNKIDTKTNEALVKHAGDMLKESKTKAIDSIKTMESAGRIDKILQSGNVNLGPGANISQYLDRIGQLMNMGGKNQAERVANTRMLIQGLAQFGLQSRSLLEGGGSISNFEQELISRASTGDISDFTPSELKTFIRAIDTQARSIYKLHQDQLKNTMEDSDEGVKKAARFYKVPVAPPELPPLQEQQKEIIKEGRGGKKYRFKGGSQRDKNNWELVN